MTVQEKSTKGNARVEEIFEVLCRAMVNLSTAERRVALRLYRTLAAGDPVGADWLAVDLDMSASEVSELLGGRQLSCITFRDEDDLVIGFGGLSIRPMNHTITVNGRTLYTWCAWDALFIPALLDAIVDVASRCPQSGDAVRVTVGPEGVVSAAPETTMISFLLPETPLFETTTDETVTNFCHYVHFLRSEEDGRQWMKSNDGTFLLSLEQAFELGRMNNEARFGAVLSNK